MNSNYKTLNLEAQKHAAESYYKVYKEVSELKKNAMVLKESKLDTMLLNNNVLAISR